MAQLRAAGEKAGFQDVRTILATGNLVFRTPEPKDQVIDRLDRIVADHGLRNDVFLRQPFELAEALARNPFPEAADQRPNHMLVLFLEREVEETGSNLMDHTGPEHIAVHGREVYIDYVEGVGRSRLTPALLERRLGQPGTARNWNTIGKLVQATEV